MPPWLTKGLLGTLSIWVAGETCTTSHVYLTHFKHERERNWSQSFFMSLTESKYEVRVIDGIQSLPERTFLMAHLGKWQIRKNILLASSNHPFPSNWIVLLSFWSAEIPQLNPLFTNVPHNTMTLSSMQMPFILHITILKRNFIEEIHTQYEWLSQPPKDIFLIKINW